MGQYETVHWDICVQHCLCVEGARVFIASGATGLVLFLGCGLVLASDIAVKTKRLSPTCMRYGIALGD